MIDINIDRIQRLLILNDISNALIGYDEYLSSYFLKFKDNPIHIFPGYNQNYFDEQDAFISKLLISDCTAAVPVMNLPLNSIHNFQVFERPNLFTINLSEDLGFIWSNIRKKRQNSIDFYSNILRFDAAENSSPLIDVFVNLYLELQFKRAVPLVNFFDSVALKSIIKTSAFKLFYSVNLSKMDSILFHLVRINGDRLEYLFSANTDLESRNYSAYLHWNIIKWSKRELDNSICYDLGGGIVKDDGVERFKREIGGVAQPRWYCLYPRVKYNNNEFFPCYASFLNLKDFIAN